MCALLNVGVRGGTQPVVQHGADEMRGDTCQPDLTDSVTKNLNDEPIVQRWSCKIVVLSAGQEYLTREQYQMCLPQHLNDLAASLVTAEVKYLPRSITHVGSTSIAGEFKDLTTSEKYLNGSGYNLVAGGLRGLSATESYLDVGGGGERLRSQVTSGDVPPFVTDVDVYGTSVAGYFKVRGSTSPASMWRTRLVLDTHVRTHTPAQKWGEICEVSVWRGLRDFGKVDREDGARRVKLREGVRG